MPRFFLPTSPTNFPLLLARYTVEPSLRCCYLHQYCPPGPRVSGEGKSTGSGGLAAVAKANDSGSLD